MCNYYILLNFEFQENMLAYCHYVKYIPMYNENLNLRSGNLLLISFSFGRCLGFYNNSVGKYCLT